jgi:hypothetical protein
MNIGKKKYKKAEAQPRVSVRCFKCGFIFEKFKSQTMARGKPIAKMFCADCLKDRKPVQPKALVKCTYCGLEFFRQFSATIGRDGKPRKIVKCQDCRRADPKKLFWNKVDKSGGTDACWPWTGSDRPDSGGHGNFGGNYFGTTLAHRISWILANGPVPDGLNVLHNCPVTHNPLCCNPRHLIIGDQKKNVDMSVEQGTHFSKNNPGEKHPNSVLSDAQAMEALANPGPNQAAYFAKKFGVSAACIRDIWRRKNWKHLPLPVKSDPPSPAHPPTVKMISIRQAICRSPVTVASKRERSDMNKIVPYTPPGAQTSMRGGQT